MATLKYIDTKPHTLRDKEGKRERENMCEIDFIFALPASKGTINKFKSFFKYLNRK